VGNAASNAARERGHERARAARAGQQWADIGDRDTQKRLSVGWLSETHSVPDYLNCSQSTVNQCLSFVP